MDTIIRTFEKADQENVKSLILAGLEEHFGVVDYSLNPDLNDIWQEYISKGSIFLVAERDKRAVGTAALLEEDNLTGRIVRMSVDKSYRRLGIARRLMEQLLHAALVRGYTKLVLSTDVGWEAIDFYRSFGFEQYAGNEVDVHMQLDISHLA